MIAPWPSVLTMRALRAGTGVGSGVGDGIGVAVGGAGVGVGGVTTVGLAAGEDGAVAGLLGPAGPAAAAVGGGLVTWATPGLACGTTGALGVPNELTSVQAINPKSTRTAAPTTGVAKISACRAGD
jgi:hypothetical protein